ncbi:MAG: hypothetical protein WC544_03275 [Patescibacteria group bacterium]
MCVAIGFTHPTVIRLVSDRSPFVVFQHAAIPHDDAFTADLIGDGRKESFILKDGRLTIERDGTAVWRSPFDWWVDQAVVADADNDGSPNLVMSVWKSGDYGPSRPFWVSANNPAVKNHLFVFKWEDGAMQAVWQSSNLVRPNCSIAFADVDNDGQQELVVTEGEYADSNACGPRFLAVWKWDEWGFTNLWRDSFASHLRK